MGSSSRAARHTLTEGRAVRVVPDLPTFSVDDGFAYLVPEGLEVQLGSIVRVPLGGRRIRGWVVATDEPARPGLREVLGVSGDHPVLTKALLEVVRWAAVHYVAPVAALLAKTSPPNLPRGMPSEAVEVPGRFPASEDREITAAAVAGRRVKARVMLGPDDWVARIAGLAGPAVEAGGSLLVVGATVAETEQIGADLRRWFGARVRLASSELAAAETTRSWVDLQRPGMVLVGTRETVLWPLPGLVMAVVGGDGRRALKERATPTLHARDVLWRRSGVERFTLVLCATVPTSETLGRGALVMGAQRRAWGLVEVVDRTEEPPGGGVIASRTKAALRAVVAAGGRALLFTDRRSPAMRCVRCRKLRSCPGCGARPDRDPVCPRCGTDVGACSECGGRRFEPLGAPLERVRAEAAGALGAGAVGEVGSRAPVVVGTERDLPALGPLDLAVIIDADGLIRAPHYRAVEDGFRLMARVVAAAGSGRGRRAIVQTADAGHPAVEALRRGDAVGLIRSEIEARAALGFPPHGELLIIEARNTPEGADRQIRAAIGDRAAVFGPAIREDRHRWLIQGIDLRPARLALRGVIGDWRDSGARVGVDADPIDL